MATWTAPPTANQTRLREARIVWNRDAVGSVILGMADAAEKVAVQIIKDASAAAPKDAAKARKRGVPMLKDTGRVAVFAGGKNKSGKAASLLVSGTSARTQAGNKPKGAKTPVDQVVAFMMFDSPIAHLQELGTVKMPANPFLLPAVNRSIGGLSSVIVPAIGLRLQGSPASVWAKTPGKTPARSETLASVLADAVRSMR